MDAIVSKTPVPARVGDFLFDPSVNLLRGPKGAEVVLRPQTARVLGVLIENRGRTVTKSDLMEKVWADTHVTDDSLVQCVSEIRKALGPRDGALIRTISGTGYVLKDAPSTAAPRRTRVGSLAVALAFLAVFVGAGFALLYRPAPQVPIQMTLEPVEHLPRVAVLPFEHLGGEAYAYLAEGMVDDITTALAKSRAFTVISRESSFLYRDRPASSVDAYPALDASHVVQGSFRGDAQDFRVNVRLTRTEDAAIVWAETFRGGADDLMAFEADVVDALRLHLSGAQGGAGGGLLVRTSDRRAYRAFQLGRQLFFDFKDRTTNARARDLFREALSLDPEFAMAQAMLAVTHSFDAQNGWTDDRETSLGEALAAAEKAIELDPAIPLSYFVTGLVSRERGDYVAAMIEADKALERDPNYANAQVLKATLLYYAGHPEESVERLKRAMLLNPHHPFQYNFHLGQAYFILHRYDDAIATLNEGVESNPASERLHVWLAASYARAGLSDDAAWEVDQVLTINPGFSLDATVASYPFREDADRQNFAEALSMAGLL